MKTILFIPIILIVCLSSCNSETPTDNIVGKENGETKATADYNEEEVIEDDLYGYDDLYAELSQQSPAEIISGIGEKWTTMSKENGEWVIVDECYFGIPSMTFDKEGAWIKFTGGGDVISYDIVELSNIDLYEIKMVLKDDSGELLPEIIISKTQDDIINFNKGNNGEESYVLANSEIIETIPVIKRNCE